MFFKKLGLAGQKLMPVILVVLFVGFSQFNFSSALWYLQIVSPRLMDTNNVARFFIYLFYAKLTL